MATKKELTVTTPTDLVPFDYGDDAGSGMDITMEDLKIPFISLAQSDSKILDEDETTYAPGGAPGMLFNGATLEFSDELILALAIRKTTYVEWLPDRGGFVGEHGAKSAIVLDAKRNAASKYELRTAAGNELTETRSIYAIILTTDLEPVGYCIVPFTGSKMGPWRDYWTIIDTARVAKNAPLFAHTVRLSSKDDKNKSGKKYKNLVMTPAQGDVRASMLEPTHPAYLAAKTLRDAVESGSATADQSTARAEGSGQAQTDEVF